MKLEIAFTALSINVNAINLTAHLIITFLQSRLNFCFIFSINEVSAWFTNHYSIKLTKKNKKNNHSFPLLTWGYNKLKQSQNNTIVFKYLFIVKWIKATASKFNTLLSSSCQFTFLTKKITIYLQWLKTNLTVKKITS